MRFTFFDLTECIGSADGETVEQACRTLQDDLADDASIDELTATSEGREWAVIGGRWQETKPGTYRVLAAA